ncbi:MAG TPA: hypothetical protein VK119_08550 [Bacillota bacterium]|nr:hypothetical protein [Bacillota bacterium]
MGRTLIVLLLLVVFFLTGMLYGMDQSNAIQIEDLSIRKDDDVASENRFEADGQDERDEADISYESYELEGYNVDGPAHFTQKMASILESVVNRFYEMVVRLLYQISQLFF